MCIANNLNINVLVLIMSSVCAILSFSGTIDVQFTIGYLNDNNSCIDNSSSYPPIIFQYRQQLSGNEWITKLNTSYISSTYISHGKVSW